jgi:hypothetical protein
MFVEEMQGFSACELGHRNYQHPKRSVDDFDLSIDNFSALVIYLSLISLAQSPGLWREFNTGENLIFSYEDFLDPRKSRVFSAVKRLGGDCRRLADLLEGSCHDLPSRVPHLSDLVSAPPRTKLPGWMVSSVPADVVVTPNTREVGQPGGPAVAQIQQVREPPPLASAARTPAKPGGSGPVWSDAWPYFRGAAVGAFVWGFWGLVAALFFHAAGLFVILLSIGIGGGIWKASQNQKARIPPMSRPGRSAPQYPATPSKPSRPSGTVPPPSGRTPVVALPTSGSRVGSSLRLIYHRPTCNWASRIGARNKVPFRSSADARAMGYRACRICNPY